MDSLQLGATPGPHEVFGNICTNVHGRLNLTYENSGRRPIAIKNIMLVLSLFEDNCSQGEYLTIRNFGMPENNIIRAQDITYLKLAIESKNLNGMIYEQALRKLNELLHNKKNLFLKNFIVHTTNGLTIYPKSENR